MQADKNPHRAGTKAAAAWDARQQRAAEKAKRDAEWAKLKANIQKGRERLLGAIPTRMPDAWQSWGVTKTRAWEAVVERAKSEAARVVPMRRNVEAGEARLVALATALRNLAEVGSWSAEQCANYLGEGKS